MVRLTVIFNFFSWSSRPGEVADKVCQQLCQLRLRNVLVSGVLRVHAAQLSG